MKKFFLLILIFHVTGNCSEKSRQLRDPATGALSDTSGVIEPLEKQIPEGCESTPAGMACIPAGNFQSGAEKKNDVDLKNSSPSKKIYLDVFYIDKKEITNGEYEQCVKENGCKPRKTKKIKGLDIHNSKLTALGLGWENANDFCKWQGKRLPTEAEWEKAARGAASDIYPWGSDKPACDKANFKECNKGPQEPGTYPEGHFGIFDMAGNGSEWIRDLAHSCSGCPDCKDGCGDKNPQGPCNGIFPCKGHEKRILKGGSYLSKETELYSYAREVVPAGELKLYATARCVSSYPILNKPPGWMISNPPADLTDPEPPSKEEIAKMIPPETDKLNKQICTEPFKSPAHCKDPMTYFKSNESRLFLFAPFVKNLGGGYAGVAADGNYSFIAHARSRWVWLFDFDANINRLHKIIRAVVLASKEPKDFAEAFNKKRVKKTIELLEKEYKKEKDLKEIIGIFKKYQQDLYPYYTGLLLPHKDFKDFGWLRNPKAYKYIRLLYTQGRIAIVPGDMLKDKSLIGIAKAAREIGTPMRIWYPSNAEEFWDYNANYKNSLKAMPFDEASVALRTIHEYPWHPQDRKGFAGFWHYVVHGALNYQKKIQLPYYKHINDFKSDRFVSKDYRDLSLIELPGSLLETVKK